MPTIFTFFNTRDPYSKCAGCEAWQQRAQQTEKSHSHTNAAVSRQVHVYALLVQHLYSVFFNIWFWYGSNIRNSLDAEKAEKSIKTYRFYRAKENNQ